MELREAVIPLPVSDPAGYRRVLLLGTTGAGKTTLVRQLIGTDPSKERFPSTSTAKTTIRDTEIVLSAGSWRAVVTFASRGEVRAHLGECVSAAVLAAARDASDAKMLQRLLDHVSQRFRFRYVLGNGPRVTGRSVESDDEANDDEEAEEAGDEDLVPGNIDMAATEALLAEAIELLRKLAEVRRAEFRDDVGAGADPDDKRAADELFDEHLDGLLYDDEVVHHITDALMAEIEKRFAVLSPGQVTESEDGWPLSWSGEWPEHQRAEFLSAVSRFSSNYSAWFGRLLTPLVNGVRVAGPFSPTWNGGETPKLVLLDGEGLGHTPKSSTTVSTAVSRGIAAADAVLLVDNAAQPMQAAPLAAMREVVVTGNARKLIIAFTHFDEVRGDNLPTRSAREQHVLDSAENALEMLGQELDPAAERTLRQRVEGARFFLGRLHKPLNVAAHSGQRTLSQLHELLGCIDRAIDRPERAVAGPVYNRVSLLSAIGSAAEAFHAAWRPLLGLDDAIPGVSKEHWTRVKALSRRLGEGWDDEYDTLRPVADLRRELINRIYGFVQNPVRWEGPAPTDEQKRATVDAFAEVLGERLLELCNRRVWHECMVEWEDAYEKRGTGSTIERAQIIGDQIYGSAAPVRGTTPSNDLNQFVGEVFSEVVQAAGESGAVLA